MPIVPKARGTRSSGSPPWPAKNEGGTCRVATCQMPSRASAVAPAKKQATSPMISAPRPNRVGDDDIGQQHHDPAGQFGQARAQRPGDGQAGDHHRHVDAERDGEGRDHQPAGGHRRPGPPGAQQPDHGGLGQRGPAAQHDLLLHRDAQDQRVHAPGRALHDQHATHDQDGQAQAHLRRQQDGHAHGDRHQDGVPPGHAAPIGGGAP